jgi:hypothetical protein
MWVLIFLFISLVWAVSWDDMQKKYEEFLERFKNYRPQSLPEDRKKKLEEDVKRVQEEAQRYKGMFEVRDGQLRFRGNEGLMSRSHIGFQRGTAFYLLMSSSVPKSVWKSYADFVESAHLEDKVVFVLRGCVGGCTYIRPTLEFLQDILKDGGRERNIGLWIDPFIFRRFGVKEVPCLVMVKGDELLDVGLSPGRLDNLKARGKEWISCGDWSLGWHFRELCEKSKEEDVCTLARKYSPY